jgi:hypothetical protein
VCALQWWASTSHVTSYTLHVTRCKSPVTRHSSDVTRYTTQVDNRFCWSVAFILPSGFVFLAAIWFKEVLAALRVIPCDVNDASRVEILLLQVWVFPLHFAHLTSLATRQTTHPTRHSTLITRTRHRTHGTCHSSQVTRRTSQVTICSAPAPNTKEHWLRRASVPGGGGGGILTTVVHG